MIEITTTFVATYVLMPLLGLILAILALVIAKKNGLLSNKKLIIYVLVGGLILSIPGLLGYMGYLFMPYIYVGLQVLYLLLGIWNMTLMRKFFPMLEEKPFYVSFILIFAITFFGAALFSLAFNLLNELQFGLWACTCILPFMLPPLFYRTVEKYMKIPASIYDIWKYSENADLSSFESMNYDKFMVIEIEVYKNIADTAPTKIKAKTPDNILFGVWFQKFLHDYNQKFSSTPIQTRGDNAEYGWIFYYKKSFFQTRKYIDFNKTVSDNDIMEKYIIVAKRVMEDYDGTQAQNGKEEYKII